MITFEYVEEYVEFIAGYRDPVTKKLNNSWMFNGYTPVISLARYDIKVIESMANQATSHQAFTERQAELACKIILKYQRQLETKLVDVSAVNNPKWRVPLRKMDYRKSIWIEDNVLLIKFPFTNTLIEDIRAFSKTSQGMTTWDKELKVWKLGLTEYNLSWTVAWAELNQFDIDPQAKLLMEKITDAEKSQFNIELNVTNNTINIINAESSLINYIDTHVGGVAINNLLKLVDMSPVLGYTINKDLASAIITNFGARFYNLASNREVKINPATLFSTNDFDSILDYADTTERWPVVIYEPDLSGRMLEKLQVKYGNNFGTNYIYTVKPITNLPQIPLLISSAGMIFGGDKQLMLQRAEKIVYYATEVYTKNNSKSKVTSL